MKPRIYLRHGIWCCRLMRAGGSWWRCGHGYTPRDAYLDWKAQQ